MDSIGLIMALIKSMSHGEGKDGKSAYAYAVEGGYTGTEKEFANKLAAGALIVTVTDNNGTLTANKNYIEIRDAILAGTTVLLEYDEMGLPLIGVFSADSLYFGLIQCINDDSGAMVGTIIIEITDNGEVNDISAYIEKLPNPHALTIKVGDTTVTYDGSAAKTIEFAAKLAQDPLSGTTSELTPTQVYDAISSGRPVKVQYTDSTYGLLTYTNFSVAESMGIIAANLIVYFNGSYILGELWGDKSSNKWGFNTTMLTQKSDIPTDDHINSLIDTKLGVIENGAY